MKTGFKLYIQEDMAESDKEICQSFLDGFISKTTGDPRKRYFGARKGGYTSGLWRGRYGLELSYWKEYNTSKPVVFRRISKNSRQFACVYSDTLQAKNDSYLDKSHDAYRDIVPDGEIPDMCQCGRHKASIKVDWIDKPEFALYCEYGEHKG